MKTTLLALTLAGATLLTPLMLSDALACGNSVRHDLNQGTAVYRSTVRQAERYLTQHQWAQALIEAQGVYPELKKLDTSYQTTEDLELKRAAKIAATAIIRIKSQRSVSKANKTLTNKDHITWATTTLEHLHAKATDDPALSALYAEALALEPATKPQALATLNELHTRDLLPGAYSYALLSKLHSDAKDTTAAKEAHTRCMTISSDNKDLCGLNIKTVTPRKSQPKSRSKSAPRAMPKNLKSKNDLSILGE